MVREGGRASCGAAQALAAPGTCASSAALPPTGTRLHAGPDPHPVLLCNAIQHKVEAVLHGTEEGSRAQQRSARAGAPAWCGASPQEWAAARKPAGGGAALVWTLRNVTLTPVLHCLWRAIVVGAELGAHQPPELVMGGQAQKPVLVSYPAAKRGAEE